MTKIHNNPLLQGASGKFGETHVYRKVRGQMQMINAPSKSDKLSASQEVMSSKLKKAANYWTWVKKHPDLVKAYEKRITTDKFTAYHVAVSDSMNSPTVHYIKAEGYTGNIGDLILIKATDDFKVKRVMVRIENAKGKIIEIGDATRLYRNKPQIFKYVATVANPSLKGTVIKVRAFDMPDNKGEAEVVL
jgi:hypothetical protein